MLTLCHTLFMALAIFVVARGVERGLEQAVRFMVPALLVLMFVLLGYSINSGFFGEGVEFMFTPDFDKLTWGQRARSAGTGVFHVEYRHGCDHGLWRIFARRDIHYGCISCSCYR